jgi:hypothetical protein
MTEKEWTQVLARAAWGEKPLPDWIEKPPPTRPVFLTEDAWLACDDPRTMLLYLQSQTSDRKLRLFAVACCRVIWDLLPGEDCREKVELAEQFADGIGNYEALGRPYKTGYPIGRGLSVEAWRKGYASFACAAAARESAWEAATHAITYATKARSYPGESRYGRPQATLLREIVGNTFGHPFRPVLFSPSWRTDTAVALARQMYESRDFSAMPILADALQDAGCDHADILGHCRGTNQVHVWGCWVVDLVLGKS